MVELAVKSRCGKCDFIFVIFILFKLIIQCTLSLIRAYSYALAAVDASLTFDHCLAISYSNCFGGATLYAMCTSLTKICLKGYRMMYSTHGISTSLSCLVIGGIILRLRQRKNSWLPWFPHPQLYQCSDHPHISSYSEDPYRLQSPRNEYCP